jgi:beta-glucosidase
VAVPLRELRAFEKVTLEPGASVRLTFELDARAFSHWDVRTSAWLVSGGDYRIEIGRSASDIELARTVYRRGPKPAKLTLESRVSEFLAHPVTGPIMARAAGRASDGAASLLDMVASMPMRRLMRFPGVGESLTRIGWLMAVANNRAIRSIASRFRQR